MSQIVYRANLNAAKFPFISQNQGQSIIVRGYDNTFVPAVESGRSGESQDVGIPQIYYCHNVVPTAEGLASIGWTERELPPASGTPTFRQVISVRDDSGNRALIGFTTSTTVYKLEPGDTNWVSAGTYTAAGTARITAAYVSGVTYILIGLTSCRKFNFSTNVLDSVTLTGLTIGEIKSIAGSSGYLLAVSKDAIAWSSTVDPTDFVPSLSTGAGGGSVEGARGDLTCAISTVAGIIVYTSANAVAGAYSGNARFPFNFREVVGAGGLEDSELAASDGNASVQYAYTSYGLQSVSFQQAAAVFPEVTDFIAGKYFEDFNTSSNEFEYTDLTVPMQKKLSLVAGRYLVLSYGVTSLTHAIYYDIGLKRFGKLKLPHVDVFEYTLQTQTAIETAKETIGFLQANGTIYTVDSSVISEDSSGVLICGKYQYLRQRKLQLDVVTLENIKAASDFALYNMPAIDGKNFAITEGYLLPSEGLQRNYAFSDVADNHSLLFVGGFSLNTLKLAFHIHGRM